MVMPDKRDECGCHRECEWLVHECVNPCRWPRCLTEDEHARVLAEVNGELNGIVECAKSRNGRHDSVEITNPMTGLGMKMCRHCGRELA